MSVNPVDLKVRTGTDPARTPTVLSYDAAGTVRATGADVTLFKAGDTVYYAGAIDRPGTNSQFLAVDERITGAMPATLNFAQAAALPLTAITAWEGLYDKLGLTGDSTGTLLIVGVGSMVIQLAKTLVPGLRVIASATRPESRDWAISLGADATVNHGDALAEDVRRAAPEGIDYIFSTNSTGQSDVYVDILNSFGQIVSIDDPGAIERAVLNSKSLSWHAELMFTRSLFQTPDMIEQHRLLNKVAAMIDAGTLRTTLTTTLSPINAESLRAAHAQVESGSTVGKFVIANA